MTTEKIKTPTGWWCKINDDASRIRKIHNEIELELRQAEIKPISYADRTNDLGVFHFGDRGIIYVMHAPDSRVADDNLVVRFVQSGKPDMEYFANKEKVFSIVKKGYTKAK